MEQYFKVQKENCCQSSILYQAELSFESEDIIKIFSDTEKLRKFSTQSPSLGELLANII